MSIQLGSNRLGSRFERCLRLARLLKRLGNVLNGAQVDLCHVLGFAIHALNFTQIIVRLLQEIDLL